MKPSIAVPGGGALSSAEAERSYDRWAPVYDLWSAVTESRAHRRALDAAELASGQSVLEVAVGTGALFARLGRVAELRRLVGTDLSGGMLGRARERLKSAGCRAAVCRADARRLPFPGAAFDVVLNGYMLDLLPEAELPGVLAEFHRTLKAGGKLILVYMAQQSPILNALWMWLFRHAPTLVGGCRPVAVRSLLEDGRWRIERQERISQNGFRSELIVARAMTSGAGAM